MNSFLTVQSGYKVALTSPVSWLCGANPTNRGVCSFDLNTEVQVGYFSLWFDALSSSRPHCFVVSHATMTVCHSQ